MKYKAVIFDFDDTLVKTREVKWAQHKAVAKRFYDIDLTEEVLQKHRGKPYDETLRQYYQNADTIENMRSAKLSLESSFPLVAQEGAVALVEMLLKRGVVVGVLSSSAHDLVIADLTRLGFPVASLCKVQASEETRVHKPDPLVFAPTLTSLAHQGITTDIMYVGDALSDWRAAYAAGLDFVGVTSDLTTKAMFLTDGVTQVVQHIGDIRYYLT